MRFVVKAQGRRGQDVNMIMRGFVKIQTAKVLCLRLQCLERIRADVLKFTTGTEGQVNKMSDDLISRKALMEGRVENDPVRIAATCADTAFNKEKVIEELEEYLFEKYCVEGDEKITEIVEKGGIG